MGKHFVSSCFFLVQNASYERLGEKPWGIDEHKWNFTKMYVESLRFETKSLMSEASDSGMGTEGAPSEFDVDIGGQYRKVKITKLSFCDDNNNNNNNNNNNKTLFKRHKYLKPEVCGVVLQ